MGDISIARNSRADETSSLNYYTLRQAIHCESHAEHKHDYGRAFPFYFKRIIFKSCYNLAVEHLLNKRRSPSCNTHKFHCSLIIQKTLADPASTGLHLDYTGRPSFSVITSSKGPKNIRPSRACARSREITSEPVQSWQRVTLRPAPWGRPILIIATNIFNTSFS